MKTSCFSIYKGDGRISVARSVPRNAPAGYRVMKALAPGIWFNSVSRAKYTELYWEEVLAPLNARDIWDELHRLAGDAEPVLLCWETLKAPGEYCHRRMIAEWFEKELGHKVPEYDPKESPTLSLF